MRQIVTKSGKRWRCIKSIEIARRAKTDCGASGALKNDLCA
jgi:hypothetical protein